MTLKSPQSFRAIPSVKVREEFRLTYELKGAQTAVNYLSRYYGIRRMKIVVDGRRVGNSDKACYYDYVAYFKKKGLNKRNVLHEFFHHLAFVCYLGYSDSREEREAKRYSRMLTRMPL